MSRWQMGARLLAAALFAGVCAGACAQAQDSRDVRTAGNILARLRGRDTCAAPPDRTVPTTTAMLGKPVTLATAPLDALSADLKLDAGQKKRINAIQDKLEKDVRDTGKNTRGEDSTDRFAKMNDLLAQADKDIDAELTPEQKPLSTALLKKLSLLRATGLPPELYLDLKLTPDQWKSLEDALPDIKQENKERSDAMLAAARSRDMKKMRALQEALGDKVSAILNKDQKSLVAKYRKKHPMSGTPMFNFGDIMQGGGVPPLPEL